jgi:proteasome lid subunit RPN8/RPN11
MDTPRRRLQESTERVNPVLPVHYWQSPPGAVADIHLITHLNVYAVIHAHALDALPNETGGFLLGHVRCDTARGTWHIEIDETMPVEPLSQNPVHFAFTWRDVDRVRNHRHTTGKSLIGWYHTHPDIGIFLSDTDLEKTHRVLFAEPFQLALVYDPVRGRAGYFFWEGLQYIDPSPAVWREFEIAVSDEGPVPTPSDTEDTVTGRVVPVEAPAQQATSLSAPKGGTAAAAPTPAAAAPAPTTAAQGPAAATQAPATSQQAEQQANGKVGGEPDAHSAPTVIEPNPAQAGNSQASAAERPAKEAMRPDA